MEVAGQVTIGGKSYPLTYSAAALALYQQETAAIERSRCRPAPEDPPCFCGALKSAHFGVSLIRLGEDQKLECTGFAYDDPELGDNLMRIASLNRAAPTRDPERFVCLLWAGLHTYSPDEDQLVAPMSRKKLGSLVEFGDLPALYETVVNTIASYMPKAKPLPNDPAPETDLPAPGTTSERMTSVT